MNDINKIFKQAMYLLIPPPTHKNEIPTLGIGFSNRELPLTASKLLKLEDVDFILNLHIVGMCVDLVASDSKSSKDVFRAHLNCDLNEVNNFRKVVKNNSKVLLYWVSLKIANFTYYTKAKILNLLWLIKYNLSRIDEYNFYHLGLVIRI
ncbi:Uncharacterised protein [Sphingobacterium multivorum]|uniref:Uncharacterized protein n=1 Tax=Sphingobacterium multivorum TaxID=28454 RepID=A0A2X2LG55_SPHMU|nr:hypothetical protein [Sphingobacterium multivorum]SPZ88280.1 Uncharacterised protein [Sphingobacterium multivorum]